MASNTRETTFIVGAGFSSYAGLPLQGTFTDALLEARAFRQGPSKYIVSELEKFVRDTFGHSRPQKGRNWPALEDIFTCLDLSANSGHYLGPKYPPSELRRIRGLVISRIIRMLHQYYERAKGEKAAQWRAMFDYFAMLDLERCSFLSMNWDTVVEHFIAAVDSDRDIDYRCGAIKAVFPEKTWVIRTIKRKESNVPVIKVHGSVNWLYCDNCRNLFWFPADEAPRIADQILRPDDWQALGKKTEHSETRWRCSRCQEIPLGTRLATFSFLKALDFPMFQKSWVAAEHLLRTATNWVFIGYSLPAADYEFKYLLKRVQLARSRQPRIFVVTDGSQAESTCRSYHGFFGAAISGPCFTRGLSDPEFTRAIRGWFSTP